MPPFSGGRTNDDGLAEAALAKLIRELDEFDIPDVGAGVLGVSTEAVSPAANRTAGKRMIR